MRVGDRGDDRQAKAESLVIVTAFPVESLEGLQQPPDLVCGHGVPDFPDPNGHAGQLGPSSGIDPDSPQFQSALNGPCLSLAPPSWAGSGKVTR